MEENLKAGRKKLQKEMVTGVMESKRNNVNSISCNDCSVINISSSNNKFCVGRRWNNK